MKGERRREDDRTDCRTSLRGKKTLRHVHLGDWGCTASLRSFFFVTSSPCPRRSGNDRRITHIESVAHTLLVTIRKHSSMRRPAGRTLVAGLCAAAAAGSLSAVDGTLAFESGAWEVAQGGQDCHRSFPAFLWAGSNAGGKLEVCVCVCVCDVGLIASSAV